MCVKSVVGDYSKLVHTNKAWEQNAAAAFCDHPTNRPQPKAIKTTIIIKLKL